MKYLYNNSTGCIVMCNMPKKNNLKITNMVMGSVHPVIIINVTGTDLNLEYEIYYINKDILVRGNAKTGLYQVFEKFKKMPELKEQRWLDLVAELVRQSDATIYGDGLGR